MSTSGPSSAKGEKVAYFEKTPWKGTIAFGENQYLGVGLPGGPGVKSEPTEWEIHFSTSNVVSARISTHTDDGQQRFLSHSGKWDKERRHKSNSRTSVRTVFVHNLCSAFVTRCAHGPCTECARLLCTERARLLCTCSAQLQCTWASPPVRPGGRGAMRVFFRAPGPH